MSPLHGRALTTLLAAGLSADLADEWTAPSGLKCKEWFCEYHHEQVRRGR